MADCIIAKITDNLVAALHGKSITYASASHTTTCKQQRMVFDNEGSTDFIELCGPWPETLDHAGNRTEHIKLYYVAELHISGLNDAPPNSPITQQTKNVGADLVALIIGTDNNRGGYALITEVEGQPGYYFTGDPSAPEFVIYVNISVEAFINADDPYLNG
jgi:hypothetical protein